MDYSLCVFFFLQISYIYILCISMYLYFLFVQYDIQMVCHFFRCCYCSKFH